MLYCIRCEEIKSEEYFTDFFGHLVTVDVDGYPELDFCEFPDGWATVPPPEFDMEQFMAGAEPELDEGIPGYDYDVERDEIVEVLP